MGPNIALGKVHVVKGCKPLVKCGVARFALEEHPLSYREGLWEEAFIKKWRPP